jgi:ferredoxin, 2Fe-2S
MPGERRAAAGLLIAQAQAAFLCLKGARHARMIKITFIQPDNSEQVVECEPEMTLMEAAKLNSVPGIEAECGGACACATCHVYVDDTWRDKTGAPSQMEEDMLDFAFDVRDQSRLSCQIKLKPELDGLVVRVPAKQF